MTLTRDQALERLHAWTTTPSLLGHARAVEIVMRAAATRYGENADPEVWAVTGLLHDADYERWPEGIATLKPKSVRKKLKDKAFAAKVDRNIIHGSMELLGVDFDQHVQFVIDALKPHAEELGIGAKG